MIRFLTSKSSAVFTFAVLLVLSGILSYFRLPRESSPEIKQPYIFVTTIFPGVNAEDVENLVTRVIEDEISGVDGLLEITSSSQQSLSFIYTKFASDISVEAALRRVQERVNRARSQLSPDVEEPIVQELSSSQFPILIIALSHKDGLERIDQIAADLQDNLKKIPGVLDVEIAGNLLHEISIEIDPVKLTYYGLSLDDVTDAVQSANISIPGGLLKDGTRNYGLAVNSEIRSEDEFGDIVVQSSPVMVRLEELGSVTFSAAEQQTFSRFNGEPAITISLTKRAGENIVRIVDSVHHYLDNWQARLPPETQIHYAYDESDYIRQIISDLENNMFTGFLLVLLVTVFALGAVNSLFVSMAIPFSMLLSFTVLELMGITLNMVVLFSLILALGMLVDNGIVIVENIYRHASQGKTLSEASIAGTVEVAAPVITSTLTTCLAFFPIIFMPDIMGDFMQYVPITVIVVLLSSLLVALTINPVFCAHFMKISTDSETSGANKLNARIQNWYASQLQKAIRHAKTVLLLSFAVVILGFILYAMFGKEPIFFPAADPSDAIITIELPQGTPLETTDLTVRNIENISARVPASLKNSQAVTGRSGNADFFSAGEGEYHKGYVRLSFKPFIEREIRGHATIESLKQQLQGFTDARVEVIEQEMGPPSGNDISYELIGDRYEILGSYADSIMAILRQYSELALIETDYQPARPEIAIQIDRRKAAQYNLTVREIAATIRNAMTGVNAGSFRQGEDEFDIVIRYNDAFRSSIDDLGRLHIVDRDGNRIALSHLAQFEIGSSVGVIRRRELQRSVGIWADFGEEVQNKASISALADNQIRSLTLPEGYRLESGTGLQMRNEASQFLMSAFLFALFLIAMVLVSQFNSIGQPIIILISVFLSLGGVFWGYFLARQVFVIIMSGIGSIALAGVAVNNCIVLVDYTNKLIAGGTPAGAAIIEAGKTRLRPVLLTAITTVLGLLPMAFGITIDVHPSSLGIQLGSEMSDFWTAFAWAIIFGLTFATVMTLIIVPIMLHLYFGWFPPKPLRVSSSSNA